VGYSGVIGLNYQSLQLYVQTYALPADQWPEFFDGIQTLEFETMRLWREKR
jgi:hypothetical protein